jgi:hypothetical protein
MPYLNEHAARQNDPKQYDSIARKDLGGGVSLVLGIKDGKAETQSYRLAADKFTVAQAKKWLEDHKVEKTDIEPATNKTEKLFSVPISKRNDEKQYAFGWASVCSDEKGNLVIDKDNRQGQNGDIIEPAEIEKAAYDFVKHGRGSREMHTGIASGDIIESMVFTKEKYEALGLPQGKQGWWIGLHVKNNSTWEKVKSGELPEFSIHGTCERVPV